MREVAEVLVAATEVEAQAVCWVAALMEAARAGARPDLGFQYSEGPYSDDMDLLPEEFKSNP